MLFKASVSYRFDDQTNAYFTRSEGYRIGGGNNFRVCTDEEIALLSDADLGNDPPQSGGIYEDQALIRPDATTNYEAGVRRSWRVGRFSANGNPVPRRLGGHSGRWTHALQLAADQIGIDSEFSTSTVLITISALLIGAALAFGFRSRASAGNILALHYVRQRYGSDRRSRA